MKNTVLLIVAIFVSVSMKSFSMEIHLKDVAISSSISDDWGSILDHFELPMRQKALYEYLSKNKFKYWDIYIDSKRNYLRWKR